MSSKNTAKTVGFMMAITLLGKILGLVREQFMAAHYSVGMESAAFLTASRIPRVFFDAVFASAISASFIPVFNEIMEKEGREAAFRLSHRFITLVGIVTMAMTILGMFFAMPLAWGFADGFDAQTAELCANLLRILFPTVVFTGVAFSFVGILQSMDEFGIPAAMSVVSNLVILIYYLFFIDKFGIYGLAVAFLIGWGMQAVIQLPALYKKGYVYHVDMDFRDEGLRKICRLMIPVMVSTWIQPINLFINTRFASRIFESQGIAAMEYANNLYSILVGVFVLSIANVIFPKLSRLTIGNEQEAFGETLFVTLKSMGFLLFPMMIGLMTLSVPLVRLIYERGVFDSFATAITAKALFFFALGMIGFGIQTILSRAFYANQDGRTPFYSGVLSILVNILLCVLLVEKMDVGGLALASAVSSTVGAVYLLIPMLKRHGKGLPQGFWGDILKIIGATVCMAVPVVLIREYLLVILGDSLIDRILVVVLPAGAGVAVYMLLTFVFGVAESKLVFSFGNKIVKKLVGKG